jgi:selenocysteine lyase/cysteine desulfurase
MTLSERLQARLVPHAANWYAGQDPWSSIYGLPLRLAADARRFDASPAWFPVHGAGLTLPWLASLDTAAVQAHCTGLAAAAQTALGLPVTGSAIITVPVPDAAGRLEAAGIRAAVRAGAVRVGFHLYNNLDDVDRLVGALA